MNGRLHRFITVAATVLILAVAFFGINRLSDTLASTYNPTSTLSLSDTSALGNPDFDTDLGVPFGDANFAGSGAGFVTFFSSQWCIATHSNDCSTTTGATPTGTHPQTGGVPTGTEVGVLSSNTSLAIQSVPPATNLSGTCDQFFLVEFTFYDAVTNAAANGVINTGVGENIFLPLSQEDGSTGLAKHVTMWPGYLTTLFDPDGAGGAPTIEPLARYSADTVVSGTEVILQLLIFDPGDLKDLQGQGQPWSSLTGVEGFPSVTVLQDPQQSNNGTIGDFCSPLSTATTIFGTSLANSTPCRLCGANNPGIAGGSVLHKNSTTTSGIGNTGTHLYRTLSQGARDFDSDGIENALDTCPVDANTDGDPRTQNGTDNDGLDAACDPDSGTFDSDEDGDGWANRIDNCPLIANGAAQSGQDVPPGTPVSDGGPPTDSIGAACDTTTQDAGLSPTVANGHYHESNIKDFNCNGAADTDDDGWCNARETAMGTSTTTACNSTTSPNDEADALPVDFNDDRAVNVQDRALMVSAILGGTNPARFDLNDDTSVGILDRAATVISQGFSC